MTSNTVQLVPRVSVIIAAFNASRDLPLCLSALEQQTLSRETFEVIVVDDGSSDDTAALAEAAGVRVLRLQHSGPAAARNAGVVVARAPIVVFTDADCEPVPEFLEQLLEPFADPRVSGGRGVYRSRQKALVARFIQAEYEERYRRIAHVEAVRGTVNALDTSYAAYRRDVFLEAGGFDTRFLGAAGEDHELSYRLAGQGHVFRFCARAVVYHRHVASLSGYARRKFRIGYWKAFLTRQHPDYAVSDSHTTQSLKIQIVLSALLAPLLALWAFVPAVGWVVLAVVLLWLASALPFMALVARRDPAVLVVTLPLLAVRAVSSGAGFVWGMLRAAPAAKAGGEALEGGNG